jgi:hypothetical protein
MARVFLLPTKVHFLLNSTILLSPPQRKKEGKWECGTSHITSAPHVHTLVATIIAPWLWQGPLCDEAGEIIWPMGHTANPKTILSKLLRNL